MQAYPFRKRFDQVLSLVMLKLAVELPSMFSEFGTDQFWIWFLFLA